MAVAMALFLCPFPTKGMDAVHLPNNIEEGNCKPNMEETPDEGEQNIASRLYLAINPTLKGIVDILELKLGLDDEHKIVLIEEKTDETEKADETKKTDKTEKMQCKLAGMPSPLILGNANLPLRNDLRTLLYKPWTDPYYCNHLSDKDFIQLEILRDAIMGIPAFAGQNLAISSLNRILAFRPQRELENSGGYPDIFLRHHLDQINRLLIRCGMTERAGVADLSPLGLDQEVQNSLQMTLSKIYMMH